MRINAVIVTHNRKRLLLRCIRSLLDQNVSLNGIYIIDNASVDGTKEFLIEAGIIDPIHANPNRINQTAVHYSRLDQNEGGAGGFHEGMRLADVDKPDFMWIMDDDGYPSLSCLEKLLKHTGEYDYIMPISLDTEDQKNLTWFVKDKNRKWTKSYYRLCSSFKNGIMKCAVPFNGLLMSRNLIERVGWPNKEMFIWGDDFEHQYRCQKAGFQTITILDAIFYHPEDRAEHPKIFFGKIPVNYSESKLRFTCLIRNSTYNYWHYKGKQFILAKFLIYTWFFLIKKRFAYKEYIYYLNCVMDGIQGDFNRHKQFIS